MLLGYDTIKEIFGALETLGATCRILCHNSAGNSVRNFLQGGVCVLATAKMRLTSGCLPFYEAIARYFFPTPLSSYKLYYLSKILRTYRVAFPERHRISNISLVIGFSIDP